MQLDPHALSFAPPQGERRVADTHHEGVTSGPRLGEDLDLLAVHETQLEETTLEGGYGARTRAYADDRGPHAGREGGKTHVARRTAHTGGGGDSIHALSMDENGSHLQCGRFARSHFYILHRYRLPVSAPRPSEPLPPCVRGRRAPAPGQGSAPS